MLYGEEEQMENENDNRNKNNGKMPKNMQTIIILVISGLLMLMLISFMKVPTSSKGLLLEYVLASAN